MADGLYVIEVLVAELDVAGGDVVELLVAEADVVGWGVVDVVVDEEVELVVGVMAFVYDSYRMICFLTLALDLQNLHIHVVYFFHQTPEIYSKYIHILHIYTQN